MNPLTIRIDLTFGAHPPALVAYRIWMINRKHLAFRHRKLRPLMLLIVESGALYSATLLALLILYNVDSWFQYVVLDAISAVVVSARIPVRVMEWAITGAFQGHRVLRDHVVYRNGSLDGGGRDGTCRR